MSTAKIEKLRARRASLETLHAGLETQLGVANRGICASADAEAKRIKSEKLAAKDEIAKIDRRIAALEAAARRPKLVHRGDPEPRVAVRESQPEPTRIAV